MNGGEDLPANPAPLQAPDVVRDLCASLDALSRADNISHAGSAIRHAVTLGAKLFSTGAIDSHGAALIRSAATKAEEAMRAVRPDAQVLATAQGFVERQRRINLYPSTALPRDQLRRAEDAEFDSVLGPLAGGERTDIDGELHAEYRGQEFYINSVADGARSKPAKP